MDAYWRAANYLSVGQIQPGRQPAAQAAAHRSRTIKPRLLGQPWWHDARLNFLYVHLNRVDQEETDLTRST